MVSGVTEVLGITSAGRFWQEVVLPNALHYRQHPTPNMPVASISNGALEAHGLALTPERRFIPDPIPRWESAVPPNPEEIGRAHV